MQHLCARQHARTHCRYQTRPCTRCSAARSAHIKRALCGDAGFYQRRVAYVRLLGELYNYKLVDSKLVFATLHLLLAFGYDPGTPAEVAR